jgi:hypothetical protein
VRYANLKGVAVEFRAPYSKQDESYCDIEGNRIVLHLRQNVQESLIVLLHELGHYEYHHATWVKKLNPVLDGTGSSTKQYTTSHLVDVVETEFKAWEFAERIAKRLDIRVNPKQFELVKSQALGTYLKGAGKEIP